MTKQEADFIGSMNMCDEISNEAYKKIMCHCEVEEEDIEDCISREDILDYIAKLLSGYLYEEERERLEDLTTYIAEMPSVTPQPKKGHWKEWDTTFGRNIYYCTACGRSIEILYKYDFCPLCGADMREVEK